MTAYFGSIALGLFMPLWFADAGLAPAAIGQILGIASLLRVLSGPGWGNVADRLGRRRPVLIFAASAATACGLGFLATRSYWPLLLIASVMAIVSSAINPLLDSLALSLAREGRMEYGPVRAVGSASYMIATAAVGWLLSRVGTWLMPWFLMVGYGLSAVFGFILPEAQTRPAAPHPLAGLLLFRNPAFRLALASSALIQGAHAGYYAFGAIYWRGQGISDTVIGLLIAEGVIVEVLLFAKGRRIVERLGPAGLTGCAALASLVRWGVLALAPPLPVLVVVQVLHSGTFAMQHLSAMQLLSRYVPAERAATAQALHTAIGMGAPSGLITLMAGWLYARYGGSMFFAMAAIGGAALFLVAPLARVSRAPGRAGSR